MNELKRKVHTIYGTGVIGALVTAVLANWGVYKGMLATNID